MKIETYLDGELIDESEIDLLIRPKISAFITQIFFSNSYMKLKNNSEDKAVFTTIELLGVRLELKPLINRADLEILKLVWDGMIEFNSQLILEEDINNFKQFAESNFMPFTFDEFCKIEILIEE